jgi:hypothetical protein
MLFFHFYCTRLKEMCKSRNLKVGGNKSDLITRILCNSSGCVEMIVLENNSLFVSDDCLLMCEVTHLYYSEEDYEVNVGGVEFVIPKEFYTFLQDRNIIFNDGIDFHVSNFA